MKPGPKERGVPTYSRRLKLAELLPRAETQGFSRNIVNRLWAMLMGRGLVHPLDLHHANNPPSHPELLDRLERWLVEHQYDLKALLREMILSQTYQRSSVLPEGVKELPDDAFAAAPLRGLSPEQLSWSLLQATGRIEQHFSQLEAKQESAASKPDDVPPAWKTRTTQLEPLERQTRPLITVFAGLPGQPDGGFQPVVDQALHLLNSPTMCFLATSQSVATEPRLTPMLAMQDSSARNTRGVRIVNNQPPANLLQPPAVSPALAETVYRIRQSSDERFRLGREEGPIHSYGTTFHQAKALMQRREIFDLSTESPKDHERYGKHEFGQHCLLARRLLQSGVSCVKVTHFDWDAHQDNLYWHQIRCAEFDRTLVTLLDDLSEHGMLEHTLVVIVGEMGRTPQINNLGGRDHWGRCWSMAMAGCGVKPGVVYGSTNDTGTEVKDNPVKLGDLFHTYLRALGIDSRMTYQIGGQTNPVADPAAKSIDALLA